MHRDLKLGLALAVLLVGATTAFFFRDETATTAGLPQLQNPERLDIEIANRDVIPYLGAPESDPNEADPAASPWIKPAFLGGSSAAIRRTSVTPDPIRILMDDEAELIEPGQALTATPADEPSETQPSVETAPGGVHVVQSGDTLTGIAAKYLGSIARYGEIYELNRDRLSGPNALRVGMELRIPAAESEGKSKAADDAVASSAPVGEPAADASAAMPDAPSEAAAAPEASGKMFVPARKTPFVPSRYRSSGVPSAEAAGPKDAERE